MSVPIAFTQISYTLPDAAEQIGISQRSLAIAIASGDIVQHYLGASATKPVVLAEDLLAYVRSQPTERKAA